MNRLPAMKKIPRSYEAASKNVNHMDHEIS